MICIGTLLKLCHSAVDDCGLWFEIITVNIGYSSPVEWGVCVVLQFQFVNSFLSLFYIAFYLQDMQLLKDVS